MIEDSCRIPQGYRQGFITSITVTLTASILFLRFIFFDPQSGDWSRLGVLTALLLLLSILLQFFTLYRALRPRDELRGVYRVTRRLFEASILTFIASFAIDIYGSAGPEFKRWLYGFDSEAAKYEFEQGEKYEEGQRVEQNLIEAEEWYRRAADRGLVIGQIKLGTMYQRGRGVPQDFALAYMWFNAAARNGDPDATKARDELASKLPIDEVVEGQRLARDYFGQLKRNLEDR